MRFNPRNFTILKFLMTVGLLVCYINSAFAFFVSLKKQDEKFIINLSTYLIFQISIFIFGLICFVIFFLIKFNIHKKIEYKYTKKEKKYLIIIFIMLSFLLIFTFINIMSFTFYFKNIIYLIITFGIIQLILGVSISVLENFVRLNEQAIINKNWFSQNNEESNVEINKVEKIVQSEKKEKILLDNKEEVNPFTEEDEND